MEKKYISYYNSPLGTILLASKENKLIGLWIDVQKGCLDNLAEDIVLKDDDKTLLKTKKWLDRYFNRENPKIDELELFPLGSEFRQNVWKILCEIPYGEVVSYGYIAKKIAKQMNKNKMSAQAIGGAVGHNPIPIIIPCHRVVGANGSLIGYTGGLDRKIRLLEIENIKMNLKNGEYKINNSIIIL